MQLPSGDEFQAELARDALEAAHEDALFAEQLEWWCSPEAFGSRAHLPEFIAWRDEQLASRDRLRVLRERQAELLRGREEFERTQPAREAALERGHRALLFAQARLHRALRGALRQGHGAPRSRRPRRPRRRRAPRATRAGPGDGEPDPPGVTPGHSIRSRERRP